MLTIQMLKAISDLLGDGEDLVFATVLSKSGSAPSSSAAQMVLRSDGRSVGTVGGGKLEAGAQQAAARVFEARAAEELFFDLTSANANGAEMICGGRVRLLLDYIEASSANVETFRSLRDAVQVGKRCYLVASLGKADGEKKQTVHCAACEDGCVAGEFAFPRLWLDTLMEQARYSVYPVAQTIADEQFVVERCFIPSTVFIVGAGHVGQHVALVAEIAGFRTVVLDDRSEYANRERFPDADEIKLLRSFEHSFTGIELETDSYVVIVTRGHLHDKMVLSQALRTGAGYIGMIGSRTKRDKIYSALQDEGFSAEELARVHSPIGLDIAAVTPGEIAVSIVAELVQARARNAR
ncbi:MAG: XdhC family protein [Coriobacteriia bacterium]|nr:XdhC family protein [Coriobacteriia bacterium]